MALISEDYNSRPFQIGPQGAIGRELIYTLRGTDDEVDIENTLRLTAPAVYRGRVLESIEVEPLGRGVWKGHARYVKFEDDSEYTFDTSGGTQKITQSLATILRKARFGQIAPNFHGAIGVSEDRVEGVDITVPVFQFSETHRFADADVSTAYKLGVIGLTGRMNDAPFKGLAVGECLFLGASGSKKGDELWTLTFKFAASPNIVGASIGGGDESYYGYDPGLILGIDKLGWDYLWVRYGDFADHDAHALVKQPIAVYVERVYEMGDFGLLGIGI